MILQWRSTSQIMNTPSAHDVCIAAEYFGQTTNHDIRMRQNFNVDEVPDRFVDHEQKVVFVGQSPQPR